MVRFPEEIEKEQIRRVSEYMGSPDGKKRRKCNVVITKRSVTALHSFFYKNVVFSSQAEYSYFSADFRLRIFL